VLSLFADLIADLFICSCAAAVLKFPKKEAAFFLLNPHAASGSGDLEPEAAP
jgi:23S rRNA A2030 N6-methylase RlmJ